MISIKIKKNKNVFKPLIKKKRKKEKKGSFGSIILVIYSTEYNDSNEYSLGTLFFFFFYRNINVLKKTTHIIIINHVTLLRFMRKYARDSRIIIVFQKHGFRKVFTSR